jgi:hypothetical protein
MGKKKMRKKKGHNNYTKHIQSIPHYPSISAYPYQALSTVTPPPVTPLSPETHGAQPHTREGKKNESKKRTKKKPTT